MSVTKGAITGPLEAYHHARHRLASLVLADIDLHVHVRQLEGKDSGGTTAGVLNEWLSAVVVAELFRQEAVELGDPDLIAAARPRIARVIDLGLRLFRGRGGALGEPLNTSLEGLSADLRSTEAIEALYRLRRDRSAGLPAEAKKSAEKASALAGRLPLSVARCALLVELGRPAEAREEADTLEVRGSLTALQSAALWLRLRRPERAAEAERSIGADGVGQAAGPGKPWERPATAAEALLALGDPRGAADRALEAVTAYEEHRLRLARDSLRAASADNPVVARAYHTAVLSHWALPGGRSAAFACAERSRSGFLDAVHALDSAAGQPDAVRAVRGWFQAETRWAARFEEAAEAMRGGQGAQAVQPPPVLGSTVGEQPARRRIAEAERVLGEAEDQVRRLTPSALTSRRGPGTVPDAAAVARVLPPDTLLLQYHLYDQDLVCWAVTRDKLLTERQDRSAHDLVATARRVHTACASGGDVAEPGRLLADALLGFCSPLLASHRRIVVVPPAQLSLVPFHALAWAGTVIGLTHEVSYLPASSLLTRPGSRLPEPDWTAATALLVGAPAIAPERGLAHLPGTATEVAAIERLLPRCRLVTGRKASRAEVLKQAAGCGILHLATHGDVPELSPHLSRLALADRDHLGLDDLLGPDVTPELLVLSACDTGRGTATAGGDVLGLTRAAVISGARHAVVSLWRVDDITGCLVIAGMYRHLTSTARPPVGTALALAQREIRDLSQDEREEEYARLADRAAVRPHPTGPRMRSRDSGPRPAPPDSDQHPYYWAPFIHVGPSGGAAYGTP
ncbi:CHAT domain-containing protein [Streptomyces sp. BPTC-684]|uniref:CHAT domain-containing protein n=1 Tax=Streptomyces sp. BPTC-684 TaxID=3043734 RepID=UPI0024B0668D|nr:CHAT domain-containing protein [Streptomyces sp. BPTC-684]WHM40031.1 CHAT domain-containing protein [Streptomyces sp. BPTC-684]